MLKLGYFCVKYEILFPRSHPTLSLIGLSQERAKALYWHVLNEQRNCSEGHGQPSPPKKAHCVAVRGPSSPSPNIGRTAHHV
uniref:Uncharacterized protein n=1 Tax=Ralstonia syzygii R24 TaxID=907261 RepID=G3A4C1_9RALS|nr:hypothetical protein RALSY_30505 [Ralstonia syzygii R24]